MAADYCFLKFICVHKSFKKHFPHLSLGVPAHQTKPPIWFSTAVNFAALLSTRLQGGKQQLHSVQFSILCLPASCQKLACFWEPPVFEALSFFSFWHFRCCRGPPRLGTKVVRQRGQAGVSDAIAEHSCHRQPAVAGSSGAAAEPQLPGSRGQSCWGWGCLEQGWPQDRAQTGAVPEESTWHSCAVVPGWSLVMLLEGSVVLCPTCTAGVGRGMILNS